LLGVIGIRDFTQLNNYKKFQELEQRFSQTLNR